MSELRQRLRDARLYFICDGRRPELVERALRGGAQVVQLRVKDEERLAELSDAAAVVRALCEQHRALFIVNDHPHLVGPAGADGVHLGQDDEPAWRTRELLGPGPLIGLSTHTPDQIDAAPALHVDYIGVGPVHATPTKPGRPAVGLDLVRYAAAHASVPFFAIGGIDAGNVEAVREAGARGVAVVRAIADAEDPELAARVLRGETVGAAQS